MKATWCRQGDAFKFRVELDKNDNTGPFQNPAGAHRMHELSSREFYVKASSYKTQTSPHPDLIALSLIILYDNFIGSSLYVQEAVTKEFHDKYKEITGKDILPVDSNLPPRSVIRGRPGLAYSGGIDSTAALAVMPSSTIMFFSDRRQTEKQKYDKTAAHQSCKALKKMGREVHLVETDLEYVIKPHTFPHPLAAGIPAILSADDLNLDTLAFGNILENLYGLLKNKYTNNSTTRKYDELFGITKLQATHVTAGLSEVTTTSIVERSGYRLIAQSCMYGRSLGVPCMNCIKCHRKTILEKIYNREHISVSAVDAMLNTEEVARALESRVLIMHNTYMYVFNYAARYSKQAKLLCRKLGSSSHKTDWMEKWYKKSDVLICKKYRSEIVKNIQRYIEPMSIKDEKNLKNWNLTGLRHSFIRWFWHWRFWSYYGKKYGKHILKANHAIIKLKQREKLYNLRVYRHIFWSRKDITDAIDWGSSDGSIAYFKNGYVKGKNKGKATLYARFENTKLSISVEVV